MLTLASLILFLAPPAAQQQPPAAQCALSAADRAVPVRSYFKNTTPVLAELPPSTPLRVVEDRAPWSRVQVPGGLVVYVHQNYLTKEGDGGTINAASVRARPLPSDGQESYPVGIFNKGDKVQVLGMNGPWYQVLAPETLSGWMETKDLSIVGAPTASWDKEWADARAARVSAVHAQAAAAPAPGAQPGAKPAQSTPPVTTPPSQGATGNQPSATPGAAQVPGSSTPPANPSANPPAANPSAANQDPYNSMSQAESQLNQMIAADRYDAAELDQLNGVFATVALNSSDTLLVERAQNNQTRLEAYRKAKQTQMDLKTRQDALNQEADAAEAAAAAKAHVQRPTPAALETYQLSGWLFHRPGVYSACPYVISNGAGDMPILSVGNRYDLADYMGREVAARGNFRPATVAGMRVLEITELRVLPVK